MKYKFAIIGLGKVGSAMLALLKEAGHIPVWVASSKNEIYNIKVFPSIPDKPMDVNIVFITVPDGIIPNIASQIGNIWGDACKKMTFFHMSGQLTSDILSPIATHWGEVASLHPLQSILDPTQAKDSIRESYFTVEGTPLAVSVAMDIVTSFGGSLIEISAKDKTLYHTAAVIASNYTVSLIAQATDILNEIGMSVDELLPLIRGTVSNIALYGKSALTGPIQRGDWETVKAHMDELGLKFPDLLGIYQTMGIYTARLAGRKLPDDLWDLPKILEFEDLVKRIKVLKKRGNTVVFTNGCFDIIHAGHISYLRQAKSLGDFLVVGLNSDASVKRLKGEGRPVNDQYSRAVTLSCLSMVNYVTIFTQDTPYDLIAAICPEVLVKGGDWSPSEIVGSDIVRSYGGDVLTIPFIEGYSTSDIIEKIKKS